MRLLPKFLVTWLDAKENKQKAKVVRAENASKAKENLKKKGRYNFKVNKVSETFIL